MSSKKKKKDKIPSKEPDKKPSGVKPGRKMDPNSIRGRLYARFDEVGCDNVTIEEGIELAKMAKPDTRFNNFHMAFYRKNYRKELTEKLRAKWLKEKGKTNSKH